jgi:hypothetical protein
MRRPLASDSAVAWRMYAESCEDRLRKHPAGYAQVMPLLLFRIDRLEHAVRRMIPSGADRPSVYSPSPTTAPVEVVHRRPSPLDPPVTPYDRLGRWPDRRPSMVTRVVDTDGSEFVCDGNGRRLLYLGHVRR